jgi:hypothetical protein
MQTMRHAGTLLDRYVDDRDRAYMTVQDDGRIVTVRVADADVAQARVISGGSAVGYEYRGGWAFFTTDDD